MEPWKINKIKDVQNEINVLKKDKDVLIKNLERSNNNDGKLQILKDLTEIFHKLETKYFELGLISESSYKSEINNSLDKQIKFYSRYLDNLKKKYKISEIPFEYFLKLANLQYKQFQNNREEILQKYKDFEGISFGETIVQEINLIINNIILARHNVEEIIRNKRKTLDFESLYLYFEVLGDFYINNYALEEEVEEYIRFPELYNIDNAFQCYEQASSYKSKIELPSIYMEGLAGIPYLKPFYDFYKGMEGSTYNVDGKMHFIYQKFTNYLNRKTKSYCWKTGNYCEYRKDKIFSLNEGNGVFISMNYSNQNNFKLLFYIEKILKYFNLNPILKQKRMGSPSWTKEICCTIFNNKFAIVYLDKYSPNVVLELGMCFGMGRKTIILINENQQIESGSTEEQLFSMVRDYDCVVYRNAENLYENLFRSIYGLFFNNTVYEIPNIQNMFNKEELDNLKNLIQQEGIN